MATAGNASAICLVTSLALTPHCFPSATARQVALAEQEQVALVAPLRTLAAAAAGVAQAPRLEQAAQVTLDAEAAVAARHELAMSLEQVEQAAQVALGYG